MYLIALPDLHGTTHALPHLVHEFARADMVLLVGDLTTGGTPDAAIRIVTAIRQHTPHILAVCGNWDTPATAAYLSAEDMNLEDAPRTLHGVTFLGVGGALRSGLATPNEYTEDAFTHRLTALAGQIPHSHHCVVVCHQPPARTRCDRTSMGDHVGSTAVRRFLEQVQPRVCLTGHIHEGVGIDQLGATTIVNPGPLWMGGYATIEWTDQDVMVRCHQLP